MSLKIQYDLFKDEKEVEMDELKKEVLECRKSNDKVRKGLFARHNELAKMYLEIHNRMNIIEHNLCKGN